MLSNFPTPVIFAHRGASAHAPENTIPAFELAIQQGADGIELDAKLSADGEVIVIHDATVDRTTNGHGEVSGLACSELLGLDAGSHFSEKFRHARIPKLGDVFEAIAKPTLINIELTNYYVHRDDLVERVCALINRHNNHEQILFSSFFVSNLKKASNLLPKIPRGLLALDGWKGAWARSFGFMFGNYQALHPNISDTSARQISRVHQVKRRIHVWTVNAVQDMKRLREWGVDGIFTDDPLAAAREFGRRRG